VSPEWDQPVDLTQSGLDSDHKNTIITLPREEAGAFSKDDGDVGCVPDLQMDINLTDNQPV
jgi:hypothetical protein